MQSTPRLLASMGHAGSAGPGWAGARRLPYGEALTGGHAGSQQARPRGGGATARTRQHDAARHAAARHACRHAPAEVPGVKPAISSLEGLRAVQAAGRERGPGAGRQGGEAFDRQWQMLGQAGTAAPC